MLKAIAVTISLTTTPLTAETEDPCPVLGELSGVIMENRQAGTPISKMMSVSPDNDLVTAIILQAYQQPRYSTEKYRQRAIDDFANTVMTACYMAM